MLRTCAGIVWVVTLLGCMGFGVYEMTVVGDTCSDGDYPLVPCVCTSLESIANIILPCALATLRQTKVALFFVATAKLLAYILAARFANDFILDGIHTRLMFIDTGAWLLMALFTGVFVHIATKTDIEQARLDEELLYGDYAADATPDAGNTRI